MDISKIEFGPKYKCDFDGAQYFGVAKEIKDGKVSVVLGDKINEDGDRGEPIDRLGNTPVWLAPESIHPISNDLPEQSKSGTEKIYVDASQPATLRHAGGLIECATLQEAKIAWDKLSATDRSQAIIRVRGGTAYTEDQIARFHYA